MAGSYAIKGIPMPSQPDPHHPIPLRKEVTAWANDSENAVQLSLFIQALAKFQSMDYRLKLSYFQVAGIHGYPATSWDGADTPTSGGSGSSWYCNHNKTTFPTWHRPYMLLFEQRIYEIMMDEVVAHIQPAAEQRIWAIEASHWRLPYWDWAADQPYLQTVGIPQLFTQVDIKIVLPSSQSKTVPNPLWSFKNPGGVSFGDQSMSPWMIPAQPWSVTTATSRHANSDDTKWVNGENNFVQANASIQAHAWDFSQAGDPNYAISDLVSRLLSEDYLKTWRYFSSTLHSGENSDTVPSPTDFLSLEEIHNNIHTFTGGTSGSDGIGHMQDPGVASLDPIFFFHHCNVDRQFAMWQTLNPDKWFDNLDPTDTGAQAALPPFHKDTQSTLYTSDDIRDWTKLNYQYDTLENTPRWIRALKQGDVTGEDIAGHVRRTVNLHLNKTRQAVLAAPDLGGKENDYIVNILYDRYGLDGRSYSIHFFVGSDPDTLPAGSIWQHQPGYVGTVSTFSSPLELTGQGTCQSCIEQRAAGAISKAQVVLTLRLIDQAKNPQIQEINSLHPEEVEAYLTKHLTWKAVEAITGRVVPIQELPRTKVFVLAGKAEHHEDPHWTSQYGGYEYVWAATEGKAGGAVPRDRGTHMEL